MRQREMMKHISQITRVCILLLLVSCSRDFEPEQSQQGDALLEVNIAGMEDYKTRRVENADDGWSTNSFTFEDVAGFFTTKGNLSTVDDPTAENPGMVINGQMSYLGKNGTAHKFGNSEIRLDPSQVASGYKYLYFPYSPELDNALDANSTEGMKIRVEDGGIEKCVDFMYSSAFNLTNGVLSPTFTHLFAEMIVIPGEGFDQAQDQEIKVVLASPWTDLRVRANYNTSTGAISSWTQTLYYNGPEDADSKLEARTWEAWKGMDYKNRKAWYALLPTTGTSTSSYSYSTHRVSYIELKDNYGNVQKVSDFYFHSYNGEGYKSIYSGRRYPIEVILTELGPIVRPVVIDDWDEPTEITDKREKGIGDYADFENWAAQYNTYMESGRMESEETMNALLTYGDATRDVNGRLHWTFYVTDDIEFTGSARYQIKRLEDTLIGASNYVNFTLSKLKIPLVETLDENGALVNLDFKDLYVASQSTVPVGGLFTTIKGGRVENCNITLGIVVGAGPVGMIAGEVNGATISYCTASGSLYGASTSATPNFGLFGTEPYNTVLTDNESGEIIFEMYNE